MGRYVQGALLQGPASQRVEQLLLADRRRWQEMHPVLRDELELFLAATAQARAAHVAALRPGTSARGSAEALAGPAPSGLAHDEITIAEAARMLSRTERQARNVVQRNELGTKLDGRWVVSRAALDEHLAAREAS